MDAVSNEANMQFEKENKISMSGCIIFALLDKSGHDHMDVWWMSEQQSNGYTSRSPIENSRISMSHFFGME